MISDNLQAMINEQAAAEANASSQYLSMAVWCDSNGLPGAAKFLYFSSDEEREHTLKFLKHVVDSNGHAVVPAVPQPPQEFNSLPEIFEAVLELEMSVASSIHKIVDQAWSERDHATFNFLQFFVAEQHQAEITSRAILDSIKLIQAEGRGLYSIDQYIGGLVPATPNAE